MAARSADWFEQAQHDLEAARVLRAGGRFDWAAFVSQQAAEKALKAALQKRGSVAWGHSVVELLRALAETTEVAVTGELRGCGIRLDRNYIGARYPNGWPEGAPHDHYTEADADEAIDCAEKVLRFCGALLV